MSEKDAALKHFDELFGISLDSAPDEMERAIMLPTLKNVMEEKANRLRNFRGDIEVLMNYGPNTLKNVDEALQLLRTKRGQERAASQWFSLAVDVLEKLQFPTEGWNIEVKPIKTPSI